MVHLMLSVAKLEATAVATTVVKCVAKDDAVIQL